MVTIIGDQLLWVICKCMLSLLSHSTNYLLYNCILTICTEQQGWGCSWAIIAALLYSIFGIYRRKRTEKNQISGWMPAPRLVMKVMRWKGLWRTYGRLTNSSINSKKTLLAVNRFCQPRGVVRGFRILLCLLSPARGCCATSYSNVTVRARCPIFRYVSTEYLWPLQ